MKAIKALNDIVKAYCMSLSINPPIPDPKSQTANQVKTILAVFDAQKILIDALDQAAKTFRQYEQNHMQKKPPDTVKAWRNKAEAEMCENAIRHCRHE